MRDIKPGIYLHDIIRDEFTEIDASGCRLTFIDCKGSEFTISHISEGKGGIEVYLGASRTLESIHVVPRASNVIRVKVGSW